MPDRSKRIEEISRASMELEPSERTLYISKACGNDKNLEASVHDRVDQYQRARQYFAGLAERLGLEGLGDPKFTIIEGQTFGKYKVEHQIGSGAMGIVYRAIDTQLSQTVALKFLSPRFADDTKAQARFLREAQVTQSLDHKNILTVYEVLEYKGLAVIVSEYIEGETLKAKLEAGPLTLDIWRDYTLQLANGLRAAHDAGIIHRDLKPSNVMVSKEGVVKILDFGLAKLHEATALTRTGATIGTIAYMSPEQARGEVVDHRSDIWSLGVMLYEMLSGKLPFKGAYDQAVVYSILHHTPDSLELENDKVPLHIASIVHKALSKDSGERYQNVSALQEALTNPDHCSLPRSQRLFSKPRFYAILVGCFLIAFLLASWPFIKQETEKAQLTSALAILPFETADSSYNQLADGLLISTTEFLGQIDDIDITAPSSTLRFRGRSETAEEIGKDLTVPTLIKGSLSVSDDSLFVVARLQDIATDATLWSKSFSEERNRLQFLRDTLATAIAEAIQIAPSTIKALRYEPIVNAEAFRLFTEAKYFYTTAATKYIGSGAYARMADSLLSQATLMDSTFSNAHGLMASRKTMRMLWTGKVDSTVVEYIDRVLTLDPSNKYGLSAKAIFTVHATWDWDRTESIMLEAISAHPGDADLYMQLARLYNSTNRDSLAFRYAKRSYMLAPLSLWPTYEWLTVLTKSAKYEEAMDAAVNLAAFDNDDEIAHAWLGKAAFLRGHDSLAVASFDKFVEITGDVGVLMSVNYRELGHEDIFEKKYREVMEATHLQMKHFMFLCLQEREKTMYWLEKDMAQNPFHMTTLLGWDYEKLVGNDPRFQALLKKANLDRFLYYTNRDSLGNRERRSAIAIGA